MNSKYFILQSHGLVCQVSFNNPDKANALNLEMWEELKTIFSDHIPASDYRVVLLTGEGPHWCAGIDLALLTGKGMAWEDLEPQQRASEIKSFILSLQSCINAIERCPQPVIAAIHKGCIGAAVDIATACDLRYATKDAFFSVRETQMGLVADLGTLQRLPRIISYPHAMEMALTGRDVMASEAADMGLVLKCFEDKDELVSEVLGMARNISQHSPRVIRGIKKTLLFNRDHSIKESLENIADYNATHLSFEDIREAITARMEGRPPQY